MSLQENVDTIREIIYELEEGLIQKKKFLDNNQKPIFITNVEIQNHSILSTSDVIDAIKQLDGNEFIIFRNLLISDEKDVEFLIRSRIYHTIWCLYRTQNRPAMETNVGDFQYIRYIKRRPSLSNKLDDIFLDRDIQNILGWGQKSHQVILDIINHLKNTSNFNKISNFQLNSTNSILKNLQTRNISNGLVLVAGTGAGKSFAYQFPLLLWILNKKIKKYEEYVTNKIKKYELHVNCSAILVFPRNSLARDQNDTLRELIENINDFIIRNISDTDKKEFLKIKNPVTDFGGGAGRLDEVYGTDPNKGFPDIIITTPSSLNHRLINPECHPVFREGVDIILYDEVHLWEGIGGAEIASLNARLQNLFKVNSKSPLFIGMSATIDNPNIHCQKLFCLLKKNQKLNSITQNDIDDTEKFTIEHHLMLKPASGRYHTGVAIESTSCLIHNRRDGLSQWHDDANHGSNVNTAEKPKSITFLDSLHGSGKYTEDLNNYEDFEWSTIKGPPASATRINRKYFFYNRPRQGQSGVPHTTNCDDCINRTSPEIFDCEYYGRGECWYYSLDDANQFANLRFGNWHPFVQGLVTLPLDNIRSKQVSSQQKSPRLTENKYNYFKMNGPVRVWDGIDNDPHNFRSEIDNLVSTPTLEVGVDFNNIKEIIQVGQIRSPTTYKQKAGRGAREGNLRDGLFVMSIIDESPLSYYYFKHFKRLITSTLDPLKLEITNPNVVNANGFLSVFDFLAFNGINLFRIKPGAGQYLTETEIDSHYSKAFLLLSGPRTKKFIVNFFNMIGIQDSTNKADEIIKDVNNFLNELSKKYTISINNKNETHTLHEWFVRATEDHTTFKELVEQLSLNVGKKKGEETEKILDAIAELKESYKKFFPSDDLMDKKLDEFRVELVG